MSSRALRTYAGMVVMLAKMPCRRWLGTALTARRGVVPARQVIAMLAFVVVELQRPGHGLEHRLRRSRDVATLEAGVVVDAHLCSMATSSRRSPCTRRR